MTRSTTHGSSGAAVGLLAGAALTSRAAMPALHQPPPTTDFDALLAYAAAWLLTAVALWTAVVAAALLMSRRRHIAVAGHCLLALSCPRRWRTPLLAAVGAASVAAASTPAQAEGWRPPALDRPADVVRIAATAPHPGPGSWVRVAPGDSLWSLVRGGLPAADDATVAVLVRRTYAANRAVIGSDPNLLHPGEQLRMLDPRSAR